MTHALRLTKQMLVKVCRQWASNEGHEYTEEQWNAMDGDAKGDFIAEYLWDEFRRESGEYTEAEQNAERDRLLAAAKLTDEQAENGASGRDLDVKAIVLGEEQTDVGKMDETMASTAQVVDTLRSKKR